jgi:hypothetical protein
MNVLPKGLRDIFKNMYYFKCDGVFIAVDSDFYKFDLNSDDASLLYVNGKKVIDNDNAHGPTVKSGQVFLRKGVHTFSIHYAQSGGGQQALELKVDDEIINPKTLYY